MLGTRLIFRAGHPEHGPDIGNDELLAIFDRYLVFLVTALESAGMVELRHDSVKIFEEREL